MSGRKQHYIPKFFLVAFAFDRSGERPHVWLYRRGRTPVGASVFDVAAQRDFYADPSDLTLDTTITKYEGRLATQLQELRSLAPGTVVDSAVAAELVTHLTIRTAHLPHTFSGVLPKLVEAALARVDDPAHARRALKLDEREPDTVLLSAIENGLSGVPQDGTLGLPRSVLRRIARVYARENFDAIYGEQVRPALANMVPIYTRSAIAGVREGHRKVLREELAPTKRVAHLANFHWQVVEGPTGGLILPDCVAVGVVSDGRILPLSGVDLDDVVQVILPITPEVALLGVLPSEPEFSGEGINLALAKASNEFFVAAGAEPDFGKLAMVIGEYASVGFGEAIASAIAELRMNEAPAAELVEDGDSASGASETDGLTKVCCIPVRRIEDEDSVEDAGLTALLNGVLGAVGRWMPVDRLASITFATDCIAARGRFYTNSPGFVEPHHYEIPLPYNNASVAIVESDGVLYGHIFFSSDVADEWLSGDLQRQRWAAAILLRVAAEVACPQLLDEVLPGARLGSASDEFSGMVAPFIDRVWSAYCGGRASALTDPMLAEAYDRSLLDAVVRAQASVRAAHFKYSRDGDIASLYYGIRLQLAALLQHCGEIHGHRDGSGNAGDEMLGAGVESLTGLGLSNWFSRLGADLRGLWERRGIWESADDFLVLSDYIERLLWGCGLLLESVPGGMPILHVRIPAMDELGRELSDIV